MTMLLHYVCTESMNKIIIIIIIIIIIMILIALYI
jgi:hypothetical protein